jgi:hypothetical protein
VLCQDAGSSERVQVPFLKDERGWHIFCLGCSDHVDDDVVSDEGESLTATGASLTVDNSCDDGTVVEPAADVSGGSAAVQQHEAADETSEYEATADAAVAVAITSAGEFVEQCTAAAAAESGEGEEEKKPWGLEWLDRYIHTSAPIAHYSRLLVTQLSQMHQYCRVMKRMLSSA